MKQPIASQMGIKLPNAPRVLPVEHQRFHEITNHFAAAGNQNVRDYFTTHLGAAELAPVPQHSSETIVPQMHGAEAGERKWFQFFTHNSAGEFSGKRTIISAAIVAAVGMGIAAMNRKRAEEPAIAEGQSR